MKIVILRGTNRGSRSNGAKNVDPLQTIVFIGAQVTLIGSPLRGEFPSQSAWKKTTFAGKIQH
jgi:hypothetical protein